MAQGLVPTTQVELVKGERKRGREEERDGGGGEGWRRGGEGKRRGRGKEEGEREGGGEREVGGEGGRRRAKEEGKREGGGGIKYRDHSVPTLTNTCSSSCAARNSPSVSL